MKGAGALGVGAALAGPANELAWFTNPSGGVGSFAGTILGSA